MKKLFLFLVALLVTLALTSRAYCADGDELTTNSFRVDSNGQVQMKRLVEVASTSDTVTATESGKLFLTTHRTGWVEFTLPDAAAGLTYTFTAGTGSSGAASTTTGRTYIDPAAADVIVGCLNAANEAANMIIGDSIYNNSMTGDSVTLVATSDTGWACTAKVGTWSDGGTNP